MKILDYKGFKSTRLAVAAIAWITATGLLFMGKLTGAEWVGLTQWTVGLYAFSEVGTKGAAALKK